MIDIERAASAIVAARRARVQIPALASDLAPTSIEEAYAIQDSSMRLLGPVGGWKTNIAGDLRCAPISADTIFPTPAKMPADWPYKIEAEIGIMIGKDLDERQSASTIRSAIASVHPAIEMVLSRFEGPVPMEQGLADCQSCEAVIIGEAIEGWANSVQLSPQMALSIDGEIVAATSAGASLEAMLPALAWLANQALARGWPLRKGHFVITGARLKTSAPGKPCNVAVQVGSDRQAVSLQLV